MSDSVKNTSDELLSHPETLMNQLAIMEDKLNYALYQNEILHKALRMATFPFCPVDLTEGDDELLKYDCNHFSKHHTLVCGDCVYKYFIEKAKNEMGG